jgi:hypothetical protein
MSSAVNLHKKYVRNTPKKANIKIVETFLCNLRSLVPRLLDIPCKEIYINTRVIKHLYDKRPAQEFDFILSHIVSILKYPDQIYKNKRGKRGGYCFLKNIEDVFYLCCVEITQLNSTNKPRLEVVTIFIVAEKYLSGYELLWERKGGGTIHRNAVTAK